MCSTMQLIVVFLLCVLPVASGADIGHTGSLGGKVFMFPKKSDDSYVRLVPQKPLSLTAFTLCMRVAPRLHAPREVILFAYRTLHFDELNVWIEKDGRISFYLSGAGVFFRLPTLTSFKTHLCFTWSSSTGLTAAWVNGHRTAHQVYQKGHAIRPGGIVLLGQDPDSFLGDFDAEQSFEGEIADVNLWDQVLTGNQIKALYAHNKHGGNVIDWNTAKYAINKNVHVLKDDI
ncbi:C-reactive protein-like isoform X2 [Paramisgurnus dabryanus]|uniref:C-reactive protein-like isoform X2 n=1 Tax=Paramisgurnus dabryanus TaxID=90735 RepID=UPI0031F3A449